MALRLSKIANSLTSSSSATRLLPQNIRTMASSAPKKFEFLVVVPDFPGAQAKRLEVRPTHFANLTPLKESGTFQLGGAVLSEVPKDDSPSSLKFAGSALIVVAGSKEEVLDILKKDVYVEAGVWDLENIWPLKAAFRHAL